MWADVGQETACRDGARCESWTGTRGELSCDREREILETEMDGRCVQSEAALCWATFPPEKPSPTLVNICVVALLS